MRATVDNKCIGCTLCASICPQVFSMKGDGMAQVIADPVPPAAVDCCRRAADECPVAAIGVVE